MITRICLQLCSETSHAHREHEQYAVDSIVTSSVDPYGFKASATMFLKKRRELLQWTGDDKIQIQLNGRNI